MTQWRPHPKYCHYLVSEDGRIRHEKAMTDRRPRADRYGYQRINIASDGRVVTETVHKMVAEAFLGPVQKPMSVNHRDGDKSNNALSNLEIVSMGVNTSKSFRAGHRVNKMCRPIELGDRAYVSMLSAAKDTGIPYQYIRLGKVRVCRLDEVAPSARMGN